jgi:hypothetical protein
MICVKVWMSYAVRCGVDLLVLDLQSSINDPHKNDHEIDSCKENPRDPNYSAAPRGLG